MKGYDGFVLQPFQLLLPPLASISFHSLLKPSQALLSLLIPSNSNIGFSPTLHWNFSYSQSENFPYPTSLNTLCSTLFALCSTLHSSIPSYPFSYVNSVTNSPFSKTTCITSSLLSDSGTVS